jgi:hypothetical protein
MARGGLAVAPVSVFLAAQEAAYVIGEVIGMTGGMPLSSLGERVVRFLSPP